MHIADGRFNAYQRTYVLRKIKINRYFLFVEIKIQLPKKIASEARTGNIPYIVMGMLTDLIVEVPRNNDEIEEIGSFFQQLDNLITLHQRKCLKIQ